jgi:putative peptidoglycan lipid II flippase
VRFLVRALGAAVLAPAIAWGLGRLLPGHTDDVSHLLAAFRVVLLGGVDLAVFLLLARMMRIDEVTEVVDTLIRRIRGARSS